jgi:hypothetical protein
MKHVYGYDKGISLEKPAGSFPGRTADTFEKTLLLGSECAAE